MSADTSPGPVRPRPQPIRVESEAQLTNESRVLAWRQQCSAQSSPGQGPHQQRVHNPITNSADQRDENIVFTVTSFIIIGACVMFSFYFAAVMPVGSVSRVSP